MGNLYEGYLILVCKVCEFVDVVVVSIFVNLMQFDCVEDLKNYLCMFEEDLSKFNGEGVDLVLMLIFEIMYL